MGGRKWHWLVAGAAAVAVTVAVLANDTTRHVATIEAHTFPTMDYSPDNGGMVLATPTVDATTVAKPTPPPATPPPKTTSTTPPPSTSSTTTSTSKRPDFTITLSLPDLSLYFPNCGLAWATGNAPIHRGEPGYREELDGDHDGIACEKQR
jgi:hypothetical protein